MTTALHVVGNTWRELALVVDLRIKSYFDQLQIVPETFFVFNNVADSIDMPEWVEMVVAEYRLVL